MQLSQNRLDKITCLARRLWVDFSDHEQISAKQMLERQALYRNANDQVKAFFKFCAEIFADKNAASVDASIVNKNLKGSNETVKGDAVSWLIWFTDSNDVECPIIYIDRNYLIEKLAPHEAVRKLNHLILHETGHLVLHKAKLKGQPSEVAALPEMEAEAWWFCYAILGLCISQCAFENRVTEDEEDDLVWQIHD